MKYRKAETPAIDMLLPDTVNPRWHLKAIEFHHKDKAEAFRLRDKVFDFLIQDEIENTPPKPSSASSNW